MAAIKIVVIGANYANVEEIKSVVVASIGGGAKIMTATIDNYKEFTDADLYVCLINRKQEVISVFGEEKVVALTLVPPTEYFLEISKIPANSSVVVFNNSTSGVKVLMDCLYRYGLTHIYYEIVPYDEWDYHQIALKISNAKYILGGIAYVGEGKTLYTKFGEYLPEDVNILVSPPRIATSDSISRLCHVFSSMYHKTIMGELKRLAAVDFLTEIPNHRTFVELLAIEWRRAKREKKPLALAMIDVDFFKNYNDHYGHVAGDHCLKVIAQTVKSMMSRPADFCARYGGEEFAVILPNTDSVGARHILERIRNTVKSLAIKHEYSSIDSVVTVSAGIAVTIPADINMTVEDLLKSADQALYTAKRQGRNKVETRNYVSDNDYV